MKFNSRGTTKMRTPAISATSGCRAMLTVMRAILHADAPGLLGSALLLPFVEAVGDHQAVPRREGLAEGRRGGNRLGLRVDRLVAELLVLRPERDQAPAQRHELGLAVAQAHD